MKEFMTFSTICGAFHYLVRFVQFNKQPWRSVTFSKVYRFQPVTLLKVTLSMDVFHFFKNVQNNDTKSRKASHLCKIYYLQPLLKH